MLTSTLQTPQPPSAGVPMFSPPMRALLADLRFESRPDSIRAWRNMYSGAVERIQSSACPECSHCRKMRAVDEDHLAGLERLFRATLMGGDREQGLDVLNRLVVRDWQPVDPEGPDARPAFEGVLTDPANGRKR